MVPKVRGGWEGWQGIWCVGGETRKIYFVQLCWSRKPSEKNQTICGSAPLDKGWLERKGADVWRLQDLVGLV